MSGERTGGAAQAAEGERTLAPFGRRRAVVRSVEELGVYRMLWAEDSGGPAAARPGQFYMLAAAAGWGGGADERPYLPRAFSFARVRASEHAGGPTLGFLLEEVGPGTERLARLRPGEALWLAGPFGRGFSVGGEDSSPVLVGGGIGIAPVLALSDRLGPGAPVLLGFRSAPHAEAAGLFGPALAGLTTDDGSAGRRGRVGELLEEHLDAGAASAAVRACGPPAMLEAVRHICTARSVPAELAMEAGMACGFGACYGCVVATRTGYVRLCVDGPVLDAELLDSAEEHAALAAPA